MNKKTAYKVKVELHRQYLKDRIEVLDRQYLEVKVTQEETIDPLMHMAMSSTAATVFDQIYELKKALNNLNYIFPPESKP